MSKPSVSTTDTNKQYTENILDDLNVNTTPEN